MRTINVFRDIEETCQALAERWIVLARQAIDDHHGFHAALSGGSTPRLLYQRLAEPACAKRIDWSKSFIYFGDERAVPPDHRDSNFRLAGESLLDHVPIPPAQIFRMRAEQQDIHKSAASYARLLSEHLPANEHGMAQFDLVLLGIGNDGHTASLFPGTDILNQTDRHVAAVYVEKLANWRMSITLPAINSARHIIVLACGSAKADILSRVLNNAPVAPLYPIQMIRSEPDHPVQPDHPAQGLVEWYLDSAAAQKLPVQPVEPEHPDDPSGSTV